MKIKEKILGIHFVFLNIISFGWICAIPIMVDHLNSTLGGDSYFFQFVLISTVVGLLFNIFFGRLLDKKNSRFVLSIGLLFNAIFWLIMVFADNYLLILGAFIMEGISFSALLISRAPYFYDLINKIKGEGFYEKLEARSKMGMIMLTIFLFLTSGFLYSIQSSVPFLINFLLVLATGLMVFLYSGIDVNCVKEDIPNKGVISDSLGIYRNNKKLFYLALSEGFFAALTPYLFFYLNVHLIASGADILLITYLASAMYFFRMLGAYLVQKKYNDKFLILSMVFLVAIMFLISGMNHVYFICAVFLLSSIFKEYIEIYLVTEVTKQSPENLKGTVRSFSEIISNTGIIILMLCTTMLVDFFSSNYLILLYSFLFLFCLIIMNKYRLNGKLKS